jgi:hypothetical protein
MVMNTYAMPPIQKCLFPLFFKHTEDSWHKSFIAIGQSSSPGEVQPQDRVTGGSCPPPVPTERSVRISRSTLFRNWFTAQR